MTKKLMLFATALLSLAPIAGAQIKQEDCGVYKKGRKAVCFDAETGNYTGGTYYPRTDEAVVGVCGLNPFRMKAHVKVTQTVTAESVFDQLPGIIGGSDAAPQSASNAAMFALQTNAFDLLAPPAAARTEVRQLADVQARLSPLIANLKNLVKAKGLASAQEQARQALAQISALKDLTPVTVRTLARGIRFSMVSSSDLMVLSKRAAANPSDVSPEALASAYAQMPEHNAALELLASSADSSARFIDNLPVIEASLNKLLATPADTCVQLAQITSDYTQARKFTMQLETASVDDSGTVGKYQDVGSSIDVTMGQPLFSFSLGFTGSTLGKVSYQTLGASTSGTGSTGTIAYQDNSSTRLQPMAFLNASLIPGRYYSLHMTAGFTYASDKIASNPEFLFGPSISFLKEQLFLTVGAYGGNQQTLQGNYTVGSAAPSGSLPTIDKFHWKPGFAISWRVASLGGSKKGAN